MSPEEAQRIVTTVIETLEGRGGFDWWWEQLEPDLQEDVKAEMQRNILAVSS